MTDRDPILDAARRLERERQPARDLWPGIAARLDDADTPPVRRSGRKPWVSRLNGLVAAAAVVTLIVLAPRFLASPDAGPADARARLDQAYAEARGDLARLVADRCDRLPTTACAPFVSGLETLDRTAAGLSTALASMPADAPERAVLVDRYHHALDRTRDLTSRVARL